MRYLVRALRHPSEYEWARLRPWRRHSLVLAVAGPIYIAFGCIYVFTEPTPERLSNLRLAAAVMPIHLWGIPWILGGILALVSARWPPASETWGYTVLAGLASCWAGCFAVAPFLGASWAALNGSLIWTMVAFLWWAVAGLANPNVLTAMTEDPARWASASEED